MRAESYPKRRKGREARALNRFDVGPKFHVKHSSSAGE
jgi:hypothetical protein